MRKNKLTFCCFYILLVIKVSYHSSVLCSSLCNCNDCLPVLGGRGSGLQLDGLKYFVELGKCGSFSQAARNLFISQQGLNKAVSQIEDELGYDLVSRSHNGVVLTEDGKIFLEFAKRTISDYESTINRINAKHSASKHDCEKRMTLNATPYFTAVNFGSALGKNALNDIGNVSVCELPLNKIYSVLEKHSGNDVFLVDVFPDTFEKISTEEKFEFEPIFTINVGIVCDASFPLSEYGIDKNSPVTLRQISKLPFAYVNDSTMTGFVEKLFKNIPLEDLRLQSTQVKMIIDGVLSGLFVSLLDSYAYERLVSYGGNNNRAIDNLVFIPIEDSDAVDTAGFLHLRGQELSASQKKLEESVRSVFENSFLTVKGARA